MTIPEAQKFVGRCRRILIPWHECTDVQWVRDAERSCIGSVGGMAMVIGMSISSPSHSAKNLWVAIGALAIAFVAFWLSLRLRAVGRLFDAAGPQSVSDLK